MRLFKSLTEFEFGYPSERPCVFGDAYEFLTDVVSRKDVGQDRNLEMWQAK